MPLLSRYAVASPGFNSSPISMMTYPHADDHCPYLAVTTLKNANSPANLPAARIRDAIIGHGAFLPSARRPIKPAWRHDTAAGGFFF
jgi:hypothetical protein